VKGYGRLLTLCGLLLCCACVTVSGAAPASQGGWSPPFEVSSGIQFSWFPDIAVGPEGSVHVIWGSSEPDPSTPLDATKTIDLLRYRELKDGAWSELNDILFTGIGGYTVRNSLVSGHDGKFHIVVRMHTDVFAVSAPWEQAWSAQAWSAPVQLSDGAAYYTALATDSSGALHALWSQAVPSDGVEDPCPSCADVYYRRSIDQGRTWSQPENLSRTPDGENRLHLQVDARDRLHAVWDEGFDWYASKGAPRYGVYRRSDDRGRTWTQPSYFTAHGQPVQQTTIALTSQGNPFVVFRNANDSRIYFQYSADGGDTWGLIGEIPGMEARLPIDSSLDIYALATDSRDHIHLLVAGFKPGDAAIDRNPRLFHLSWDGVNWSQPALVMDGELWPEWPRLAIANGNQLHATWFTRRLQDRFSSEKGAHYQVWYSTLQLDAPAAPAPPLFTPVPTAAPTATPAPLATPTQTPLPAAIRAAPPLDGPPAWEQRGIQTIVLALAPVFLLIAAVILMTRGQRNG
jgi:hypothetical protein